MSDQLELTGDLGDYSPIVLPPYTQVENMSNNGVLSAFGPTDFIQTFFSGGVIPAAGTELILVLDKSESDENGNIKISVLFNSK